jgi:hypothetical protein
MPNNALQGFIGFVMTAKQHIVPHLILTAGKEHASANHLNGNKLRETVLVNYVEYNTVIH